VVTACCCVTVTRWTWNLQIQGSRSAAGNGGRPGKRLTWGGMWQSNSFEPKRWKQMSISIQLDRAKKMVIIKLPLEKLRPSSSGKTELLASSHGCQSGEARYRGRLVTVTANAFIFRGDQSKSSVDKSKLKSKAGRKGQLPHHSIEPKRDEA
jgi:hypothetical protein